MAVRASISLGLDFYPGQAFAREVWRSFRQKVHPFPRSGHFTMVVSFERSSFRLDEESVALALEAAIGGFCGDLKVSVLRDRVFSFTVSSMKVGFLIYDRKKWVPKSKESPADILAGSVAPSTSSSAIPHPSVSPSSPPSVPPPPPPYSTPSVPPPLPPYSMATFEFDPTPWVPPGFHIIDGGPSRLPRTFVTPSAPMVDAHEGWAVTLVDPPPPENLLQHTMDQVRNFLLDRDLEVVNSLPWFCGIGAFQFRNPVARAALVDHGAWPLGDATLRFIKHNEGQGFRTQHGARTGWLMFIGTPMDFRNTETIAEAINTFGEFHYWQHKDIQKYRILVYATFPSPAQVPRDVVFRQPKVARFSGLRHSWTAPVYILSAEHAGVHPANEDPMPLDGNPHPLPGNLQPDNLNFMQPEYPKVGWNVPLVDAMPNFIPPIVNQPAPHEPDGVWEQHVQGSDANSAVSSASVSDVPPVVQVMAGEPLGLHAVHVVHVQDGAAHGRPVLDEVLGDHILVENVAEEDLGAVPVAEGFGDQVMVENAAEEENDVDPVAAAPVVQVLMEEEEVLPTIVADDVDMDVVVHAGPDDVLLPVVANENVGPAVDTGLDDVVSPVVATENFTGFSADHSEDTVADHVDVPSHSLAVVPFVPKSSWDSAFLDRSGLVPLFGSSAPVVSPRCKSWIHVPLGSIKVIDNVRGPDVSEPLEFTQFAALDDESLQLPTQEEMPSKSGPFAVGSVEGNKLKKRQKKQKTVVLPGPCRFTRSQLVLDGHRAPVTPGLEARPRKRSKKYSGTADLAVVPSSPRISAGHTPPPVPIPVLQRIGTMLDIDARLISTEKLMASDVADEDNKFPNVS
ncbi:hypothetical protein ACQ4PT_046089 [Festuca glaucescens]